MIIQHNMIAMNADRQLNIVNKKRGKTNEKLSSGYKINRAADDAAGLSISEKMRNQIRNLNQAMQNVEDGICLTQVADGALEETHTILKRIGELAVQAANDVNTSDDREMIDAEVQQLKDELKNIFQKTEYNGMKLFTAPYIPEVEGKLDDIQVFNVDSGTHGGYGGVTINNIRYTWEEIGVGFQEDGITFSGGTYKFNTWDDEEVVLDLKAGTTVPHVERVYSWKADERGIYVNNKLASTWEGMHLDKNNVEAGSYLFEWHGTKVSFEVTSGQKLSDIIREINYRDFNAEITWRSEYTGTQNVKAVDIDDKSVRLNIDDSWKSSLPTANDYFYIVADEEGVQLKDSANRSHTKMRWSDFHDVSGAVDSASSNGGYPIVDWGMSSGSNQSSGITLDDSAVYRYKDQVTGLEFDFRLSDEASRIEVISGISQNRITQSIVAPVAATVTPSAADSRFSLSASADMLYDLQYSSGKSFSNWSTPFNTSFSVTHSDADSRYELQYQLLSGSGRTMRASISDADFRSLLVNGGGKHIDFTEEDGNSDFKFGLDFSVQAFDNSQAKTDAEHGQDYSARYEYYLNQYMNSALTYLNNADIKTVQTMQPYQQIYISESANSSRKTTFDAMLNPIEKSLVIQSGANQGEITTIQWNCLNLTAIGMGGVNVLDHASASDAIEQVQRGIRMISAERSKFGAATNRLEKCYNNNANYAENLQSAESRLRDTDMAAEMARYSKQKILEQAGQAMLAQANQMNQSVLQLLQV